MQVIIGYKGLIDLARRSGQIVSIAAHEVCEHDHFELVYGIDEKLNHTPAMGERGEVIGFYAVAKLKDGGHCCEFMSTHQVEQIRDASQGYQRAVDSANKYNKKEVSHPWTQHFVQMGRKTVIRRLAKYLPLSVEFQTAAALDGMAAEDQHLDTIDGEFMVVPDADAPVVVDEETGEIQQPPAPAPAPQATLSNNPSPAPDGSPRRKSWRRSASARWRKRQRTRPPLRLRPLPAAAPAPPAPRWSDPTMKITRIEAENFLGIRSADVYLHKPVTLFAGNNFAGKSSLQEAVRMALTGEAVRVSPKKEYGQLVTEGAKAGFASVDVKGLPNGPDCTATIALPSGKGTPQDAVRPASRPALRSGRPALREPEGRRPPRVPVRPHGSEDRREGRDRAAAQPRRGQGARRPGGAAAALRIRRGLQGSEGQGHRRERRLARRHRRELGQRERQDLARRGTCPRRRGSEDAHHGAAALRRGARVLAAADRQAARRGDPSEALRARLPALEEQALRIDRVQGKLAADEQQLAEWGG